MTSRRHVIQCEYDRWPDRGSTTPTGSLWSHCLPAAPRGPACIAVVALAVAAIGPGRLALDRPFRWGKGGWPEAAFALGVGGISAAIVLSL